METDFEHKSSLKPSPCLQLPPIVLARPSPTTRATRSTRRRRDHHLELHWSEQSIARRLKEQQAKAVRRSLEVQLEARAGLCMRRRLRRRRLASRGATTGYHSTLQQPSGSPPSLVHHARPSPLAPVPSPKGRRIPPLRLLRTRRTPLRLITRTLLTLRTLSTLAPLPPPALPLNSEADLRSLRWLRFTRAQLSLQRTRPLPRLPYLNSLPFALALRPEPVLPRPPRPLRRCSADQDLDRASAISDSSTR